MFFFVEHINYLREVAGIDHIGIGSGFDGIDRYMLTTKTRIALFRLHFSFFFFCVLALRVPNNLNDTSSFPELFVELTAPGNPKWQPEELKKLAGLNILRVLRDVEKVILLYKLVSISENKRLEALPREGITACAREKTDFTAYSD